jgi:hypothetical protein
MYHGNNILLHIFTKSVHGNPTMQCDKKGSLRDCLTRPGVTPVLLRRGARAAPMLASTPLVTAGKALKTKKSL